MTTGSFYHYFASWSDYTRQLVAHWQEAMTGEVVEAVRGEPDPRRRIDRLIEAGLRLPHGAEAAIRVWGALDPHVRAVQAAVDRSGSTSCSSPRCRSCENRRQAELFAAWAVYLLVGYEQADLPRNPDGLEWLVESAAGRLDSGGFSHGARRSE